MADMATLVEAIASTLSADLSQRRTAEAFLESQSKASGFLVALFQLIATDSVPHHVRQATAVYMKNQIISTYSNPGWEASSDDRNAIKSAIVNIMLSSPVAIRRQLSEVLAIVAEHEYPKQWPNLVPELSLKLAAIILSSANIQSSQQLVSSIDWNQLQGVLETLYAIFDRYPERMRCDELYTEINYSLLHTIEHIKSLFGLLNKVIEDKIDSKDSKTVTIVFTTADLLCKVFYCLSWQDYPAYVQDHMQEFMTELRKLLVYQSSVVDALSDDEPGCLDNMHASILEITNLYATKFDEDFRPFLQQFLSDAWALLVRRSNIPKFDGVVTTGIKFLTSVSRSPDFHLFKDLSSLAEVCRQIVIPNIELREEDFEVFEDNPVEYVRKDMEGSDADTRRRGAVELVKGLCSHYEKPVTEIFSSFVQEMLQPQADWRKRDTALYVVTALSWKSGTLAGGATETSSLIDVVEFFNNFVMPELTVCGANPKQLSTPIFTADLMKFVISFRNQIPKESSCKVIMICGNLLEAKEPVVKTYAAACIERILTVKDKVSQTTGNGTGTGSVALRRVGRISKVDLEPVLPSFLPLVISALKTSTRADEYMMRLVLRFCSVVQELIAPYVETLLSTLVEIFAAVTANPANPLFNHYLFEAMSALIRFNANDRTIGAFEAALVSPLCNVLVNDITEFAPYVFQVMSQLMTMHKDVLPVTYSNLMDPILVPVMWDKRGYIPSMVLYIETYIRKAPKEALSGNLLEKILGIYQKLLASKATDHHGLSILTTIFEVVNLNVLSPLIKAILNVMMVRLSKAKTPKFVNNMIYCLSSFVLRFGGEALKNSCDAIQGNLLAMLLEQVWLTGVVTIRNSEQRRLCAIALTEIACGSDICTQDPYLSLWPQILNINVALTEGIVVDEKAEGKKAEVGDEEEESFTSLNVGESYSAAHSQLKWGVPTGILASPLVANKDAREVLAAKVSVFTGKHGGKFNSLMQEKVDAQARKAIMSYVVPQQAV